MYTHFVWLLNMRGTYDAQLWTQDYTTGVAPGGNYRKDVPYRIGEKVVFKVRLEGDDRNVTLEAAKQRWPSPPLTAGQPRA